MSGEPRDDYHLNFGAANELTTQGRRAERILERLASDLAASEAGRDSNLQDLVEQKHVRQAAELLFGSVGAPPTSSNGPARAVFISYSHADEPFVNELAEKLARAGITHFKADRDIRSASDWCEAILDEIRGCRVFLSVLTPRFLESRWREFEGGAACASKKKVVTALRYVEPQDLSPPYDRWQSMKVETGEQVDQLVETLKQLCRESLDE